MLRSLSALLLLAAPAAASVVVVNGDSFVLQAAIDAAADGDILLIKPGSGGAISGVAIDGKSLTLVVDQGVYTLGRIEVRNLPASGVVMLHGFTLTTFSPAFLFPSAESGSLEVHDCAGSVRVEDCGITAPPQGTGTFGIAPKAVNGVLVVGSSDVAITDCTITGGIGPFESGSCTIPGYAPSGPGGDGVRVRDGRVALLDVISIGGAGGGPFGPCSFNDDSPGGAGLRMQGASRVVSADSDLRGANDTISSEAPGSGLVIEGAGTLVQRGGSISQGGGLPVVPAIIAPPGSVTSYAAPPRGLAITSPIRVAANGTLTIDGVAGETDAVFESPAGGWAELPGKQGVFLLGAPLIGPILIVANPTGTVSVPFTTPPVLPPGVDGLTVHLQLFSKLGAVVTVEDVATCTVIKQGL